VSRILRAMVLDDIFKVPKRGHFERGVMAFLGFSRILRAIAPRAGGVSPRELVMRFARVLVDH